jgi:hypothetical protein
MDWKKIGGGLALVSLGIGIGWFGFSRLNKPETLSKTQKDMVELIGIQEQAGRLKDDDLAKEIAELEAHLRKANLVNRLNNDLVNGEERAKANQILTRLALLNAERNKRAKQHAGTPQ